MGKVKTLVYFDIEATGLKSSGKPRTGEISFVAVDIQDILQLGLRLNEERKLCVRLNGVRQLHLSEQSKFNKTTGVLINHYIYKFI